MIKRALKTGAIVVLAVSTASLSAHAQVAGGDPETLMTNIADYGVHLCQAICAIAAMYKGAEVWAGTHNIWHSASYLLGGAGLALGVPVLLGFNAI